MPAMHVALPDLFSQYMKTQQKHNYFMEGA
jgi:hypothetical protein